MYSFYVFILMLWFSFMKTNELLDGEENFEIGEGL